MLQDPPGIDPQQQELLRQRQQANNEMAIINAEVEKYLGNIPGINKTEVAASIYRLSSSARNQEELRLMAEQYAKLALSRAAMQQSYPTNIEPVNDELYNYIYGRIFAFVQKEYPNRYSEDQIKSLSSMILSQCRKLNLNPENEEEFKKIKYIMRQNMQLFISTDGFKNSPPGSPENDENGAAVQQDEEGSEEPPGSPQGEEKPYIGQIEMELHFLLPKMYVWKIYAGTVCESYLKKLALEADSDNEQESIAAKSELGILGNYFKPLKDGDWYSMYQKFLFEPKNSRITRRDERQNVRLDTSQQERSLGALPLGLFRDFKKNMLTWFYHLGIPEAGCRLVGEALDSDRNSNSSGQKTKTGQVIDQILQGLPSNRRKEQVKNEILSRRGVMRFNSHAAHSINELLEKSVVDGISIKIKVSMSYQYYIESIEDSPTWVIEIKEVVTEPTTREDIKNAISESWELKYGNSGTSLIFPEGTIQQNETSPGNQLVVTPFTISLAEKSARLIESILENSKQLPVIYQPVDENENGPDIDEKTIEEEWLKIVMPKTEPYQQYMSAGSAESGEFAWIYKIAQQISGISNSRMASLRNILLKKMRDEVRNPLADQVANYKQSK